MSGVVIEVTPAKDWDARTAPTAIAATPWPIAYLLPQIFFNLTPLIGRDSPLITYVGVPILTGDIVLMRIFTETYLSRFEFGPR